MVFNVSRCDGGTVSIFLRMCLTCLCGRAVSLGDVQAEPAPPKPVLGGLKRTASGNLVPVADDAPIQ